MAKKSSGGSELEGVLIPLIIIIALAYLWKTGKLEQIFNKLKTMIPSTTGGSAAPAEGAETPTEGEENTVESITAQNGKNGKAKNGNGKEANGNGGNGKDKEKEENGNGKDKEKD